MGGERDGGKRAKEVLSRFESLKETRAKFEPVWKECEWNVAPVLMKWDGEKPGDAYEIPDRHTNQPTNYLDTCVTGLAGYAVSPNIRWFKLSPADRALEEASGVAKWLEECEGAMRRAFESCGFYQQCLRWLALSGTYGSAAMLIEEARNSDRPIRYRTVENQELYLDNGETGDTDAVFRSHWSSVENVIDHYGRKAMHEKVLEAHDKFKDSGGFRRRDGSSMRLLHAVWLRRAGRPDEGETAGNKKWASVVIDADNKHVIRESGYDEFPYAMFYWRRDSGKPYGTSPTTMARNDINILQQAWREVLTVAQKSSSPPVFVPKNVQPQWNLAPGGINYLRSMEEVPQSLNSGANFPITLEVSNTLAQNVKSWYYVDFFLMLRQQQGLSNMTATAVAAMQGEQAALLSALVSNLYDGLDRAVQRTFNILAKRRLLPPMPFALQALGGSLKVDFQGVLAQAQKAAYEFAGITDALTVADGYARFAKATGDRAWSKAIGWLKPDELFKKTLESRGVSKEVLKTKDEYDRDAAAADSQERALASQAAEAQAEQAVLQNAQNLNQSVKPNTMLDQMLGRRRL